MVNNILLKQNGQIIIGDYCHIGEDCNDWSVCKIFIENRVLISHPISAESRQNDFKSIIGLPINFQQEFDLKPKSVTIKSDSWIEFYSIILKGVTIAEGAIVGAGSVVTSDLPN